MARLSEQELRDLARDLYGDEMIEQMVPYPRGGMTVLLTGGEHVSFSPSGERFVFDEERRALARGRLARVLHRARSLFGRRGPSR